MVSVDFFTVPTIRFQVLYVFLVLAHDRRRILHFGVTACPIAEWTAQQLREDFPWETAPRYPEFEKRWSRFSRTVGGSWRMDETYVKARGQWVYLYRAVDKAGQTVDFYLSRQRDVNAAKAFLRQAMKQQRIPTKITLDAYAASHRAVADLKQAGELPKRVKVRSSKYLNKPHRTGSSAREAAAWPDARTEEFSKRSGGSSAASS
jgi:hypothetical protein